MTPEVPFSSSRPTHLQRATRPTVPAGLAPGVDPRWAEAFLLELRLADVPGHHIGDALAEVASHCAESGETAQDAFGDPVTYARSLDLPGVQDDAPAAGSVVPWVVQTVGLMLLATSAHALVVDGPVAVTVGHLVAVVLLVAALVALGRWGTVLLRFLVRRPVVAWLAAMAHFALLVAGFVLLDGVVARVAGPLAAGLGAATLLVGTLWVLAVLRRDVVADDPVTSPLVPARPSGARAAAALRYGPALLSPVVALVLVGTTLLLG